jgi:hypothetical protein
MLEFEKQKLEKHFAKNCDRKQKFENWILTVETGKLESEKQKREKQKLESWNRKIETEI